jgi:hypothetical protein
MILFHDKGDLDLDKLKTLYGDELGLRHFEKISLLKLIDDGKYMRGVGIKSGNFYAIENSESVI